MIKLIFQDDSSSRMNLFTFRDMSENDNIQVENSDKPYSDKAYEIIDQSHSVY